MSLTEPSPIFSDGLRADEFLKAPPPGAIAGIRYPCCRTLYVRRFFLKIYVLIREKVKFNFKSLYLSVQKPLCFPFFPFGARIVPRSKALLRATQIAILF